MSLEKFLSELTPRGSAKDKDPHKASDDGALQVVISYVEKGADVNKVDNNNKDSMLNFAAKSGHEEVVQYLIGKSADCNLSNKTGNTPLHLAAYYGHPEVVNILIDARANVNVGNRENDSPLLLACLGGQEEAAHLLCEKGADLNMASRQGKTPLLLAKELKHQEIIKGLDVAHKHTPSEMDLPTDESLDYPPPDWVVKDVTGDRAPDMPKISITLDS